MSAVTQCMLILADITMWFSKNTKYLILTMLLDATVFFQSKKGDFREKEKSDPVISV